MEGLNVLLSEEGSNHKAYEIDVFKNFCDFGKILGQHMVKIQKLYLFLLLCIRDRLVMKNGLVQSIRSIFNSLWT